MKVLVVVDMQNDFITGPLGTKEAQAIVPRVKEKIRQAVENGDYIFYTQDTHFESYLDTMEGKKLPVPHCLYEDDGWKIHSELMPPKDYYDKCDFVEKFTFGSLQLPSAIISKDGALDCTEIELVGVCTDICVVTNALILKTFFIDYSEISVDATCCAGVTPETHEAALKTMEMCQINVKRGHNEVLPTIQ